MRPVFTLFTVLLFVLIAVGCGLDGAFEPESRIAENAQTVAHGTGAISFKPDERGTVLVYNRRTNTEIYSTELRPSEEIVVSAHNGRIEVNGRTVSRDRVGPDDSHTIYWIPRSSGGSNDHGSGSLPAALANARRVESGRGDLTHRFDGAGHIWVWDATAGEIVCGHKVGDNALLRVQPEHNRVLLDGKGLSTRMSVRSGNLHQIYFEAQ